MPDVYHQQYWRKLDLGLTRIRNGGLQLSSYRLGFGARCFEIWGLGKLVIVLGKFGRLLPAAWESRIPNYRFHNCPDPSPSCGMCGERRWAQRQKAIESKNVDSRPREKERERERDTERSAKDNPLRVHVPKQYILWT